MVEKLTYQKRIEKLMTYQQLVGLWTNTFGDINLGAYKDMPADTNSKTNIPMPEEQMYNSVQTLSILTSLQEPRGVLIYEGSCGNGKTSLAELIGHYIFSDYKPNPEEDSKLAFKEAVDGSKEKSDETRKMVIDHIKEAKIQCHPEQTEEKMVARLHTGELVKHGIEQVLPRKFITCPVHVLDEVNRLPPDKINILFNMIDRGRVKYMDVLLQLADGPIFLTQNYNYGDEGTFAMPPPFEDRIELSVLSPVPNAQDFEIITNYPDDTLEERLTDMGDACRKLLGVEDKDIRFTAEERKKIWEEMKNMPFNKDARNFVHYFAAQINFCLRAVSPEYNKCAPAFMNKGSCRTKKPDALCKSAGKCHYYSADSICKLTQNELSVRSIKSIYKYSKALAWLAGRKEVDTEIVKQILPYTVGHKLKITKSAESDMEKEFFSNDTVGFVKWLIDKTDKGFGEAGEIFKNWGSIVNGFDKVVAGEMPPKDLLDKVTAHGLAEIAQYDDPVKYSIICWCQKIYNYIVTKHGIKAK